MLVGQLPVFAVVLAGLASRVAASPVPDIKVPTPAPRCTLIGNGNPVQRYYYKQVTPPIQCGDDTCSSGQSKTFSISLGFSMGSGGGPSNFINGGFSVSKSWSTTETESCTGQEGDTVCLWYVIGNTQYDVLNCDGNSCQKTTETSPNNNNAGGGYICGKNAQCGTQNQDFWTTGPPGGPQSNSATLNPSNLP